MNHQIATLRLKFAVIFVSLLVSFCSFSQDSISEKWKIGISVSPNFSYQQRSTPRNKIIQMRPSLGFDFGLSIKRKWNNNFIQFLPSVGYSRNKTKSSLFSEGFNVKYLFGSTQNRIQLNLIYGRQIQLIKSTPFSILFGLNSGYGFFNGTNFQDLDYSEVESRIRNYYLCFVSGFGVEKKFNKLSFYWGVQLNQGLLTYTRVNIKLKDYETDFISRGSSVSIIQIISLNRKQ